MVNRDGRQVIGRILREGDKRDVNILLSRNKLKIISEDYHSIQNFARQK